MLSCRSVCFPSVLSLIMMVVIRYISIVLVWILTVLVIIGSIGKSLRGGGDRVVRGGVWAFGDA